MKPILFSTPMVLAILGGRKSMTRRVIPLKPNEEAHESDNDCDLHIVKNEGGMAYERKIRPRYQPGDILWVRETWGYGSEPGRIIYRADYDSSLAIPPLGSWKPSIHMPKAAARIFLRVTEVRAERLQNITEEDAKAEGVKAYGPNNCSGTSARIAFAELWDGLNEKRGYGWRSNPWVWVYAFERCEKPGGTE